jgi:hypothetical protein
LHKKQAENENFLSGGFGGVKAFFDFFVNEKGRLVVGKTPLINFIPLAEIVSKEC